MHPAASVILFTTAAGAGYGLLFLLGLALPMGLLPAARGLGLAAMALSLGLITLGLLASAFHLGHPERAWRAFSQWRSSWLSREGVAAVLTYLPAVLFGIGWVFLAQAAGFWGLCGLLAALGALLTVGCTGMIYASLKTIRQWHNGFVVPIFGAFALASGALWLTVLLQLFGLAAGGSQILTLVALALAWGLKLAYWRSIDRGQSPSSPESATGLGSLGRVRVLDPPHSGENYLTSELGFRIARTHAAKLRRIAVVMGFLLAALMTVIGFASGGPMTVVLGILAAVSGSIGIALERWLFFAEATHTVMLYYGSRTA